MDFQQPKLILIRGVSGAGKTTLAKMLGGELLRLTSILNLNLVTILIRVNYTWHIRHV